MKYYTRVEPEGMPAVEGTLMDLDTALSLNDADSSYSRDLDPGVTYTLRSLYNPVKSDFNHAALVDPTVITCATITNYDHSLGFHSVRQVVIKTNDSFDADCVGTIEFTKTGTVATGISPTSTFKYKLLESVTCTTTDCDPWFTFNQNTCLCEEICPIQTCAEGSYSNLVPLADFNE